MKATPLVADRLGLVRFGKRAPRGVGAPLRSEGVSGKCEVAIKRLEDIRIAITNIDIMYCYGHYTWLGEFN